MTQIIRTVIGVLVGIVLISMLVEGLEFGLVTVVNQQMTTNPETYYSIRNQPRFLGVKLIYNTLAAVIGGFAAAVIADYAPVKHGLALAMLQTLLFGWALTQPELRRWTPAWVWGALILVSFGGIVFGALLQARRSSA